MGFEPVRVGVIGIGNISNVYLNAIERSPALELVALSSRNPERAAAAAQQRAVRGLTIEQLLASDDIELVLDITPATEHDHVNRMIVEAGKHLYSEKPFSLSLSATEKLLEEAHRSGVKVGAAPDTFFGAAHQAVRKLLDEGVIGKPVFGQSFTGFPGIEYFHPDPISFYRAGGEPPFDQAPYYLVQWVNLLGPVRQVYCTAATGRDERQIRVGPNAGSRFSVDVPTTYSAVLQFEAASVVLTLSLDVLEWTPQINQLFGSDGLFDLASPNFFGGAPAIFQPAAGRQPILVENNPFGRPNRLDHVGQPVADFRGAGLVELALAIREDKPHRTGGELILHIVEVIEAIMRSSRTGSALDIESTCSRPAPIDAVRDAQLIELTASPFSLNASGPMN